MTGLIVDFGGLGSSFVRGEATAVSFVGNDYGVNAIKIGKVHAELKVRKSYAQALADMMILGIGYYRPGPDTIETAPDLECWSHRDRR